MNTANDGLKTVDSKDMTLGRNRRNLNSMPRLGLGRSRSKISLSRAQTARQRFGVIPILTDEMKIKLRLEKINQLKT